MADLSQMPDVTLSAEDAHFLAVRLRRLCAHLNYTLPNFAEDDASLVNIAGSVIGALLTNLTHGVTEVHTDHPLRHYDRTCPACNAGAEEVPRG